MKNLKIEKSILDILSKIAPEIDPSTVGTTESIREAFEIDSMDFLRVVVDLNALYGISIPEKDYGRISTLDEMVAYIKENIGSESGKGF